MSKPILRNGGRDTKGIQTAPYLTTMIQLRLQEMHGRPQQKHAPRSNPKSAQSAKTDALPGSSVKTAGSGGKREGKAMSELKPCLSCGNIPTIDDFKIIAWGDACYSPMCLKCHLNFSSICGKEQAIELWNRRTQGQAQEKGQEAIALMEKLSGVMCGSDAGVVNMVQDIINEWHRVKEGA